MAPLVEVDPFRDFAMDQFWGEVGNLNTWPEARYSYVLEQYEQWPLPFSIRNLESCGDDIKVTWQNAGDLCTWRLVISPDSLFNNPDDVVYETFPSDTSHIVPGRFTGSDLWMQVYATRNGTEQRSDNGPVTPTADDIHAISGSVVINEINYMSAPQFNPGDWFEVVNIEDEPLSLAGWSIRDNNRTNLTTLGDQIINPGQCMVFSSDSFAFLSAFETIPPPTWWLTFNLSDNGDRLMLLDPMGNTVDSVSYLPYDPWPWQAAGYGSTLTLLDTSLPNQNPASWIAGPFGGTPFSPDSWDPQWPSHGAVSFSINGPVPVTGDLTVQLTAIAPVIVEVFLYDMTGRVLLTPLEAELLAGVSSLSIETGELASGIYFVGVRNMGFLQSKKITILSTP